jgi:hypothetical protein
VRGVQAAQLERSVRSGARAFERSQVFDWLVRAGFIARGVTYGVIGALAVALALGAGTMGATPNQQGALALIARSAVGRPALVLIAVGLLAYALWKLMQAVVGRGPEGGGSPRALDRISNAAGGIVYIAFFIVAVRVLAGSAGNAAHSSQHAVAGLLGWPGGAVIVGAAGVILIAISLYQMIDAIRGAFAEESKVGRLDEGERRVFMTLGRVGLGGRALVFGLVGYFLLRSAIDYNPSKAVGVDGALARLHGQPYGPWLVALVAAGLLAFATFSFAEAKYRRL